MKKYLQFIGDMKWNVVLCHIDIMYATIFLSWYIYAPHKVHLSNIYHLYVHLKKYASTYIKVNTEIPNYKNFKTI